MKLVLNDKIDIMAINLQTIGGLLEQANDTPLSQLPLVVRALRIVSLLPVDETLTANEQLTLLKNNEPDVLTLTVSEILKPQQKGAGHKCMTIIMSGMLVLMSLGFAGINIYTAYQKGNYIQWEDMFLPLIGPLLIVLYDRGLLSRENRNMIQAMLGQTPITMLEAAAQRIKNGPGRVDNTESKKSSKLDY